MVDFSTWGSQLLKDMMVSTVRTFVNLVYQLQIFAAFSLDGNEFFHKIAVHLFKSPRPTVESYQLKFPYT